ncbi:hypothetical protein [Glycomyces buryatensis]|uniref:Peptidase inhibitor family I36 protein n=1 Tax=Glycomyces buryatensis TaxID=2570927 RepID=A0A4V4HSM2_9ACTN|nr:hypothetical protein [Glycomyces buryatensis]THV42226.1 hypothetical protein FAB82_07405 [Glycomyces buryatensis]
MRKTIKILVTGFAMLGLMLTAPAAAQAAENGPSGCNKNVCVYTAYTGGGYQVWAEFNHTDVQDGHLDVWGPGLSKQHSANGYWPAGRDTKRWSARGSGTVCAEGWSRTGGQWNSVGLPCVNI